MNKFPIEDSVFEELGRDPDGYEKLLEKLRRSRILLYFVPMRFHYGAIPESPDFSPDTPDAPWKPLREPHALVAQFLSLPLGALLSAGLAWLWLKLIPSTGQKVIAVFDTASLWQAILAFVLLVIVHELLHAAVHPAGGRSPRTILGFWPATLLFYAHYDGELSRNRFLAVFLSPLLVISLVPLLICAVTQMSSGWLALISVLNCFMACMDIFGCLMFLCQIPANAVVRNQGWKTYWRNV